MPPKKTTSATELLESCGKSIGYMLWGVNNLFSSFTHLSANDGGWSDKTEGQYNGGVFGGTVPAPWGICTYAHCIDKEMKKLADMFKTHAEQVKAIKEAASKPKIAWADVNKPLKTIDEYAKAAAPLIAIAPGPIDTGVSWFKNISKFTDNMDSLLKEVASSGDVTTSAGVTALAVVVAECVPIFGDLYAEALKGVPNAIRYFEQIKQDRELIMAKVYGSSYQMYSR